EVASREELFTEVFESILNIQHNSAKYNEANEASGGSIGRYTTVTALKDVIILTNDAMTTYLLESILANTFHVVVLDLSARIISFDDLGGLLKLTKDVTVDSDDTVDIVRSMGDYQISKGDLIPEGSVLTFDVSELEEFTGNVEEVKPKSDLFAYIF